jgi:hypothetical protein
MHNQIYDYYYQQYRQNCYQLTLLYQIFAAGMLQQQPLSTLPQFPEPPHFTQLCQFQPSQLGFSRPPLLSAEVFELSQKLMRVLFRPEQPEQPENNHE